MGGGAYFGFFGHGARGSGFSGSDGGQRESLEVGLFLHFSLLFVSVHRTLMGVLCSKDST